MGFNDKKLFAISKNGLEATRIAIQCDPEKYWSKPHSACLKPDTAPSKFFVPAWTTIKHVSRPPTESIQPALSIKLDATIATTAKTDATLSMR
jgi:hypothetical protein